MTCRYCGTALPDGALFCGECGQPVAAGQASVAPASVAPVTGFSISELAFSSPGATSEPEDDDRELPDGILPDGVDSVGSAARCPQCGEAMAEGDVFCGECGFVLRTVSPPVGNGSASNSVAPFIVLPELITLGEFPADPEAPGPAEHGHPELQHDADATTEVEPLTDESDPTDLDDPVGIDDPADLDDLVLESGPAFASREPEPSADLDLEVDDPLPLSGLATTKAAPSPRSRPIPDPFPWGTEQPLREDLEATRLVADSASGTRYVLQFSTGESVTVSGSGLVGRNPSMQPGEYVDQLVPIFDAGKSVSKTHLEFGQEAGRFWVSDRYSTNGSVIRQPDAEPRRCDSGRRYFIARGTRVDVGEQFFVVS